MFAERLAEHRSTIATGKRRIGGNTVERFGITMRNRRRGLRKSYVRLFVFEIVVSSAEIAISSTRTALEAALVQADRVGTQAGSSFDREWCPEEDSNLHGLATAST